MSKEDFIKKMQERASATLDDKDVKYLEGVYEAVRSMITSAMPTPPKDFDVQVREAMKDVTIDVPEELKTQVREACEEINKLKSQHLRGQIEEAFQLRSNIEKNKDSILSAIKEKREFSLNFQARAAAMHTTTNTATSVNATNSFSDNVVVDPEIALIRYPKNFILDMIRNRQVSKVPANRILKEQLTKEGAATLVPEGGLKPLMSYTFGDKIYNREKYAAHMEFTEEFELDFEALYNAILDLFEIDVIRAWHDGILADILAIAPAYISTGLDGKIVDPDMYAAIRAGILSVAQLGYNPDVVWLNPNDLAEMELTQDKNGNYKIPPFSIGERQIRGLTVYESTKIAQGKYLLGDSNTWKEEHSSFSLRFGWINEQFIHNEKSVVGEVFSMLYQRDKDKGSWIHGDITAIKAALLKV